MKMFVYLLCSLWLSLAVHAAELKFEPATPIVEINKSITLSVANTEGTVKWIAGKGKIQGTGDQATYTASTAAGVDEIIVSDEIGNNGIIRILIVLASENTRYIGNGIWKVFSNRSYIKALALLGDTLWVGTFGGLEQREAKTGKIIKVFTKFDGLPDNQITLFTYDKEYNQNILWVSTSKGNVILARQGESNLWKVSLTEHELPKIPIISPFKDDIGLTDSINELLFSYYKEDEQEYHDCSKYIPECVSSPPTPEIYLRVNIAILDNDSDIWAAGEWGQQVELYHIKSDGIFSIFTTNKLWLFNNNAVTLVLPDGKGGAWVGTTQTGLIYFSPDGNWETLSELGLPDNHISCLSPDENGGMWISAWKNMDGQGDLWGLGDVWSQGGLVHIHSNGIWEIFATNNSEIRSNQVTSCVSDGMGGVWAGTSGVGLEHLHADGHWKHFNFPNTEYPLYNLQPTINSILVDNKNRVLLSSYKGLYRLDSRHEWTVIDSDIEVTHLLQDHRDKIWIGTTNGLKYLTGDDQLMSVDIVSSHLPSEQINSIIPDKKNGIWIATNNGLIHYDGDKIHLFTKDNSNLPSNNISVLFSDHQGGVWIGTSCYWNNDYTECVGNGLIYFGPDGKWSKFNHLNSNLPSNNITSISMDNIGRVWIGTDRGLVRFSSGISLLQQLIQTKVTPDLEMAQHLVTDKRAAILIAGGSNSIINGFWTTTRSISSYFYSVLYKRGFQKEDIYFLSPELQSDLNGDGRDDRIVTAPSPERPIQKSDIEIALSWAKTRGNPNTGKLDQPLFLFFIGHGDPNEPKIFLQQYSEITWDLSATELKEMLDQYQEDTRNAVVVIIEACYSGDFRDKLMNPEYNRIIISSSDDTTAVFDPYERWGFSRFLARNLFRGDNLFDACTLAQTQQRLFASNLKAESFTQLAKCPELSSSQNIFVNGDFKTTETLKISNPLKIKTNCVEHGVPAICLTRDSFPLLLQAKIEQHEQPIERIWAVLKPPLIKPILDINGTAFLPYLRLAFYPSEQNRDIWEMKWNHAIYKGDYELIIYAEDDELNFSETEPIVLTVKDGISPKQSQMQIQLDKTRYQRGEQFKATLTENLGWGYDLYAAVVMPDGNYFTLKNTNELRGVKEAKPWYAQRKQGQSVTLLDLTLPTGLPTGQYCIYGILSPEQNDVFEAMNKNLWVYGQQCFELF